jgi:hypothetical protein
MKRRRQGGVVYMDPLKGKEQEAYGKEKGFQVTDSEKEGGASYTTVQGLKITDLREMKKKGDISRLWHCRGKSHIFQLVI